MNTVVNLWIAVPILGTAVILQWTVLRAKYRKEMTKQHARYVQHLQVASSHFGQAKRQIGQLQHDLAAARLQVKRLSMGHPAPPQSNPQAKQALRKMLDDAPASRRELPTDGFAETQPSRHSEHDINVLLR